LGGVPLLVDGTDPGLGGERLFLCAMHAPLLCRLGADPISDVRLAHTNLAKMPPDEWTRTLAPSVTDIAARILDRGHHGRELTLTRGIITWA